LTDIASSESPTLGCFEVREEGEVGTSWTSPVIDTVEEGFGSGAEDDLMGLGDADVLSLSRRDLAWASMATEESGLRERNDEKRR
jgi:hypothetical protein